MHQTVSTVWYGHDVVFLAPPPLQNSNENPLTLGVKYTGWEIFFYKFQSKLLFISEEYDVSSGYYGSVIGSHR